VRDGGTFVITNVLDVLIGVRVSQQTGEGFWRCF